MSDNNIVYNQEPLEDVLEELKPILEDHYDEIALYQDTIKLKPDYGKYLVLAKHGLIKLFTARVKDELVGYFILSITPSLHYSENLYAVSDIIYIKPEYRNKSFGYSLIKYVEDQVKLLGVSIITINTKCNKPFNKLLEAMDYDKIEIVYSKLLVNEEKL